MPTIIDRNDRRCTAFHEAGHAVAAILNGISFEKVYVVKEVDHASRPVGLVIGQVVRNFHKPDLAGTGEDEAKRQVFMAFAGPMAETLAYPNLQHDLTPNHNDFRDAISVLRFTFCEFTLRNGNATFSEEEQLRNKPIMDKILQEAGQRAERFPQEHSELIAKVAEALLRDHELSRDRVAELCGN